jgi:non-specific serine/threonine protein kinase
MPVLTPIILDTFPFYVYTDQKTIQRGQEYFRSGRVVSIEYYDDWVVCEIEGQNRDYEVQIKLNKKGQVRFDCTCPQAEMAEICKHMVAASLAVSQYLKSEAVEDGWQYRLSQSLEQAPRRGAAHPQRYAAFFGLQSVDYYDTKRFYLTAYILKASEWKVLQDAKNSTPEEINVLLDQQREWVPRAETPYQKVNPAGCLNLSSDGTALLNFILDMRRYYNEFTAFSAYLPLLARLNAPVFLIDRKKFRERLEILAEPVEIQAALARDGANLILQAGLELNGQSFTSAKDNLQVVSDDPPWVLLGRHLAALSNPESLSLLAALPLTIPVKDEEIFRSKFFRQIAERLPIQGDVVAWENVQAEAVPRLYLRDDHNALLADLRFGYGDYEVSAVAQPDPQTVLDIPGTWSMARIQRQPERESHFYNLLTDPAYRLKRAGRDYAYGTFELRARAHPFDFLVHSIPLLTQAGFEVFGDENLKAGKINRHTPSVRVNLKSGIDWFDLEAVVEYGDQQIALKEVRKALKRGEKYIKLADGSIGQIPEHWLEKYKHLWNLAEETETGFRVSDMHLALVDDLLADAAQIETPPDLPQRRERLRSFEQIAPQVLPQGFVGELRPYQKSGFDWLHFLREYRFGGILADDMGLGKTIQVLAYLQALREQGSGSVVSLLVVPKSLLTNWQRESAKFTPELKFLEYMGTARQKDTALFNDYDVILTTYGTMLRDIELLRTYRFHYAILDESQAIKNPLAQSSKAARSLNAEHRLVMTGTPVENNTFELWSQFAFTNPGLLGNMEYFRKEFATPIESGRDEGTAATLRKLVYPFILRRTKEQVAPELPPRTERILYTDMETHQRKLYTQTRERYRAELLGLIESEGLDDARMKILEGLLRLRQIAIHPALVEPTYHGEAPKFELLLETLETLKAEGHKALVFSQFIQTLAILKVEMAKHDLPFAYLDGQTKDRQAQVDLFQNSPTLSFFLISLKAGGVGLNLTAADYVIHLDPWWNPAVEMQASDRAHRIGQDKPVFIYKIIARDTVEEKILQLQERKKALVQSLIATEASFFKSLTKEDVKGLFS